MNYQHISTKQVAEYIKQDLEKEIPQVDFQVSTNGNTLDIRYVDGVAKEQVEEIVNRYDSRTYSGRHKGLSAKDLKPIQVGDKLVISEVQLFFVYRRFSVSYLQQVYDYLVNTYDLEPEVTIKVSTQDGAGMITGYGLDGHILIKQVADRGTYKYRGYTLRFGTSYEEIVDRFLDSSEPVDLRAYGIEPWGECCATYEQVKAKLLPIRVL